MINLVKIILVSITFIINGCSIQKSYKEYSINVDIVGKSSNPLAKRFASLNTNDPSLKKLKLTIGDPNIQKNEISFNSSGALTGYNLVLKIPVTISKEDKTVMKRYFESRKFVKNFNKTIVDKENYQSSLENLYSNIFRSLIFVIRKINEG